MLGLAQGMTTARAACRKDDYTMKAGLPTPEYDTLREARRIEHGLSRDAAAVQFNKELIMMQPAA